MDFVNDMRKIGQLIMGIGHRVKSVSYCVIMIMMKLLRHDDDDDNEKFFQ